MKKLLIVIGITAATFSIAMNAMESRPTLSTQGGWGGGPSSAKVYADMDKYVANGKDADWKGIFFVLSYEMGDVNEYRALDGTPLIFIAAWNSKNKEIESLLEEYEANPNIAEPKRGYTALMAACMHSNLPMVTLLLKYGADPMQEDKDGRNSFFHARQDNKILQALTSSKLYNKLFATKKLDALLSNIKIGQNYMHINWDIIFSVLDLMKKDEIDAYRIPKTGESLLHMVLLSGAGRKDISIVDALLELYKMNPNIKDQNGVTPLMLACKYGHMALVELLLKHGADPFIKDNQGKNSFDYTDVDSIYRKLEMATW